MQMRILKRFLFATILPIALFTMSACEEETTGPADPDMGTLVLKIVPTFNGAPLELGTSYQNAAGDMVSLRTVKFYISEILLEDHDENEKSAGEIYLVDLLENPSSLTLTVPVEAEHYHMMRFSVGVPEAENHKDAATQSEPLGPNVGMYWGWDPGYIFYKIEGDADSAGTDIPFLFHGGEDARRKQIALMGHDHLMITKDGTRTVTLGVAMDKFFAQGMTEGEPMQLVTNVAVRNHQKGPADLADLTAANFATIFSIIGSE